MASSTAISFKANPKTFKHALSIKLNNDNYLLWKQQVLAAIRSHNPSKFLDPSENQQDFFLSKMKLMETKALISWDGSSKIIYLFPGCHHP